MKSTHEADQTESRKNENIQNLTENDYTEGPRGYFKRHGLVGCNAILILITSTNALSNNAKQARNCSKFSHFCNGLLMA
jgi:hypothetical protein